MQCSSHSPTFIPQSLSTCQNVVRTITVAAPTIDLAHGGLGALQQRRPVNVSAEEIEMLQSEPEVDNSCTPILISPFTREELAIEDGHMYKLLLRGSSYWSKNVEELRRTRYWYRVFDEGKVERKVELVKVADRSGSSRYPQWCMKMPYLGQNILKWILARRSPNTNSSEDGPDRSQSQLKVIIQKLTDMCSGMSAKREDGFYHGNIKPRNILVSEEGVVRLVDFVNCYLPGDTVDAYCDHTTDLYLPQQVFDLKYRDDRKQIPLLLDPTVDELAFVLTVYQLVHPKALRNVRRSKTRPILLDGRDRSSETTLSRFCFDVQEELNASLEYFHTFEEYDNKYKLIAFLQHAHPYKLKANREAVMGAIKASAPAGLFQEGVPATVYDAVKAILKQDNWNVVCDE